MDKSEKAPFGYIYRATNIQNEKNYIGQTVASRWGEDKSPIEDRWKEEVQEAYGKQRRGEDLRYIERAIVKYGPENFELKEQDIAHSQEDLDNKETDWIKEYDSMNPDKGYNMKEGGRGGLLSEEAKENLSKIGSEKWQEDLKYREKQTKERRERAKNPEFIEKMTKINRERAKDPKWREKMSKVTTEKYQKDPKYKEKQTQERRERAKNPEWIEKMTKINREITQRPEYKEKMSKVISEKWDKDPEYRQKQIESHDKYKKKIEDKREFLNDIKNEVQKKELLEKYEMSGKTMNRRIEEMLGEHGVKNYTGAKEYLKDKDLDDVLKDIEGKSTEKQTELKDKTDQKIGDKEAPQKAEDKMDKPVDNEKEEQKGKVKEDEKEEKVDESQGQLKEEPSTKQDEKQDSHPEKQSSESPEIKSKELKFGERFLPRGYTEGERVVIGGCQGFGPEAGSRKDYEGIDQLSKSDDKDFIGAYDSSADKGKDYAGIDEQSNNNRLGNTSAEESKDYSGIDEKVEEKGKDYEKIDESHGNEGGGW